MEDLKKELIDFMVKNKALKDDIATVRYWMKKLIKQKKDKI